MEDRAKYLVHADLVADGVVERNDVVGAVFGQTEGLLGNDLDIRDLQDAAKVGRMDVEVDSSDGQSHGHLTIPSSLDRVETAIFAASLEAIERIGPCRATVEVQEIEDVRAAKRREIVDRAKQLLATAFDDGVLDSQEIVAEVREAVRAGTITEYEGLPAGPHVESSEAVVVVEGRSDVLTLLRYGIKNAIAVEGTNVPDAVSELTRNRTATAFLDGDRGGDLILAELEQTADVDYVARAPVGTGVEDLTHAQVDAALRTKRPLAEAPDSVAAMTDGSTAPEATAQAVEAGPAESEATSGPATSAPTAEPAEAATTADAAPASGAADGADAAGGESTEGPRTIVEHADAVRGSETARLVDGNGSLLQTVPAAEAFDAIEGADAVPVAVVLDGTVEQRLVDVAAQRGVSRLVGREAGEFVKQPVGVRVLSFDDV
jgi:DNA primase